MTHASMASNPFPRPLPPQVSGAQPGSAPASGPPHPAGPNPLLEPGGLPFGIPDFSVLAPEHYLEAAELGAREHLAELAAIAADPAGPTFANTFEAYERSGQLLRRAAMAFGTVRPAHGTAELLEVDAALQPLLSAHRDAVQLDPALYARLASLDTAGLDPAGLNEEQARLAEETLRGFRLAGAALGEPEKERLRGLNARIAGLSADYSRRLLAGMNAAAVHFGGAEDLEGLDPAEIATAAEAARAAGHPDGFLLTLVLPTGQPALERLGRAASRRRLFEASLGRGIGGEHGTFGVAAEIAALRAERAGLLGYGSHAELVLERQTAPSLDAVRDRLAELVPPAVANARREAAVLADVAGHPVDPWDWAYYSAAVRRDRYAVDAAALRPWFELESVLHRGVFAAATALYGITFAERTDLPAYHPDVRVWEVAEEDGSPLGLFLGDFFARPTKAGGAWMNSLRDGASLLDERPVVTNTLNIARPAQGGPALLSLDEVNTLFHEFGHALHGLLSAARYPSLAGTSVPRDFVEYPSQVNEMWALWPSLAAGYARHHLTGEPLPEGALEKIRDGALWGEGFATTEYLAATVLDLAWHSLAPGQAVEDPLGFEDDALRAAGFDPGLVPPRYRTGYFKHIFDSGYAAGYYSYIWSEVLDADTVEWFTEHGGPVRSAGSVFRAELLSRGNTRDPLESYVAFRGREARIEPLLRRRGLAPAGPEPAAPAGPPVP